MAVTDPDAGVTESQLPPEATAVTFRLPPPMLETVRTFEVAEAPASVENARLLGLRLICGAREFVTTTLMATVAVDGLAPGQLIEMPPV